MLNRRIYKERYKDRISTLLFDLVNIPKKFRDATVDDIPDKCDYKELLADWVENIKEYVDEGKWLYLWGGFGTGKTAASTIVLREVLLHDGSAFMFTQNQLIDYRLRKDEALFDNYSLTQIVSESNIILLDDMGSQKPNDYIMESIEWLAMNRYNAGKSLIITSNLNPDGDKAKEYITGKVLSMSYELATIISMGDYNWRKESKK